MMELCKIDPDLILVGKRLRPLDQSKVEEMMDSFVKFGQQTPISVWAPDTDTIYLVAGNHRLAAAKGLGLAEIDCVVVDMDETDRRLWEIAENLHRCELTVQERAEHVAEWIKLCETKQVSCQVETKCGRPESGVNAAARNLGLSQSEAHRSVKIASITDEAKAAAREAGLDDNQSALLEIAKAAPDEQAERAREIAAAKADRRGKSEVNSAYDKMTKEDATEQLASLLSEHIPGEHWNSLTALLYAAGAAKVAKAFNRLNGAPVFDATSAGR